MNLQKHTLLAISLLAVTACGTGSGNSHYGYYGYQGMPPVTHPYSQPQFNKQAQANQPLTQESAPIQPLSGNQIRPNTPAQADRRNNPPAGPTALQGTGKATQGKPPSAKGAPVSLQSAAAKAPQGEEYLHKARQAYENLQGMSATVQTFEKSDKEGQGQVRLLFRKPGQVKIDVLNSTDAGQKGVKLSYSSGGGQVKVRPTGVLSLVSVNLSMTDPKMLSGRKYRLDQIDLASTTQRVTRLGQQVKVMGKTQMGSDTVVILEMTPNNHFDPRVNRERIGIDMNTGTLRSIEMYEGDVLVYAARVLQVTLNPSLVPEAFDV